MGILKLLTIEQVWRISMDKYKVIALFGKSGAGKDTIQKWIVSNIPDINGIISCTTRPKRDYEEEGKDYFFLTNEDFAEKVLDGSMLEATEFRDWFYGTPISSLSKDKVNVGVFNPAGVSCLLEDNRLEVLPIQIIAPDKTRLIRTLNREDNPDCAEMCRRFFTDRDDFDAIDFDYYIFNNDDGKTFFEFEKVIKEFGQGRLTD